MGHDLLTRAIAEDFVCGKKSKSRDEAKAEDNLFANLERTKDEEYFINVSVALPPPAVRNAKIQFSERRMVIQLYMRLQTSQTHDISHEAFMAATEIIPNNNL